MKTKRLLHTTIVGTILSVLMPINGFCSVNINNIAYDLDAESKTAVVQSSIYGYKGDVSIPNTVYFNNVTYTVISIGHSAFYRSWDLTSVSIPNSVTTIEGEAFYECKGLTSISIPSSVTIIGNKAFADCGSLASVSIQNSSASIGDYAFDGTAWLENQPDGLVYVGNYAYKYKGEMKDSTDIIIRNGTLGVCASAFKDCKKLRSCTLPSGVKTISEYAFSGCRGLNFISVPNTVTTIGEAAFSNSRIKTRPQMPSSLTQIGKDAFSQCSGDDDWNIVFPTSLKSIGDKAFFRCYDLEEVIFPNTVITIGHDAFDDTIWYGEKPDGIVYAGKSIYKFKGEMAANTHLSISDGTLGISDYAFRGCDGLVSLVIPQSVEYIGQSAFLDCNNLNSVTILCSPTISSPYVFNGCSSLNKVVFDCETVTSLFYFRSGSVNPDCNVVMTNKVKTIGDGAFEDSELKSLLTIPNSVTKIGKKAFYRAGGSSFNITSLPNSVTYVDDLAFYGIKSLTSISDSLISIGKSAFSGCTGLKSVNIPSNNTYIGSNAFSGCTGLDSITISEGVTSIEQYSFYNTGISHILIPSSMSYLGNFSFWACSGLQSVTSLVDNPFRIEAKVFSNQDTATLYVPKSTKEKYKTTSAWNQFKNIVEIEATDQPNGDVNGDLIVDVADVTAVVDVMANGGNDTSADLNGDGKVDIADMITLLRLIEKK